MASLSTLRSANAPAEVSPGIAGVWRNPIVQRLARGSFWSVVSSGVGQGGSLLASMTVARLLGANEFGEFGMVLSTVNMFAAAGASGLGITATKHVAEYRQADPRKAGRILGLASGAAAGTGLLAATLLLALAPWLARKILLAPALSFELRLSAIILIFTAYNAYQQGALAGFEAFRSTAAANLVRGLCGFPILVAAAYFGGLPGAVLGFGAVTLVSCVAHARMLNSQCTRYEIPISYHLHREEFTLLYRFSVPVILSGLSWAVAGWMANAALARSCGFKENGLFQAGMHWLTLGLFLAGAVANVGLPMMANHLGSRKGYLQALAGNAGLVVGLNMLVAFPAILFAPWIVKVYGPEYSSAVPVIQIMCATSVALALNTSIQQIIWSLGRAVEGLLFSLLRAVLLVIAAYYLVIRGARGLAEAYFVTSLVLDVVQLPFVVTSIRKLLSSASSITHSEE